MKKQILIAAFFIIQQIMTAQVDNIGFEGNDLSDTPGEDCRNDPDQLSPFNLGTHVVEDWKASHGSPQLNKTGCLPLDAIVHTDIYSAFMFAGPNHIEGIYQDAPIFKDQSYNISVYASGYSAASKIVIAFTNGLSHAGPANVSTLPTPTSKQQIIEITLTGGGWEEVRVNEIVANANYSQVWIYALGNSIAVDDVNIIESCCIPNQIWQNIIGPRNTHVNDFILAGENVTTSQPSGKVIIPVKPEQTHFTAGNLIDLQPGVETEPGASFLAEIKPCIEVPMQIYVSEVLPASTMPQCTRQYEAIACFGSGSYKYTWDTDHAEHLGSPKTKLLYPATDAQLGITVTDLWTNEIVTKYITVKALPFIGDFNITAINTITPDGNGINDEMIFIDETRLNQQTFGYNAYYYDFNIEYADHSQFDFEKSKTGYLFGFPFNDIKYDFLKPNDCANKSGINGTYYWDLTLTNCTSTSHTDGVLTVLCPPTSAPPMDNDSFTADNSEKTSSIIERKAVEIKLIPNPANSKFNIIGALEKNTKIRLYDVNGKIVLEQVSNPNLRINTINSASLPSGLYTIIISSELNLFSQKVLINH